METGLQFDFSYSAGTSWEQIVAFETAGMMWSDYLKDDMTVNIHVEMTDSLPDNVIGGALPGMVANVNYTTFRQKYKADIKSWVDREGYDSLSVMREGYGGIGPGGTWEKFEAIIDMGSKLVMEDSSELNMTRANAKALGLVYKNDRALDGYIKMNNLSGTSLKWDYNPWWTPSGSLDFLSTAVHEIGHVLGFVSGVDKYQGVNFNNIGDFYSYFGNDYNARQFMEDNVLDYANPLDLFRHSDKSINYNSSHHSSNDKVIDLSVGNPSYFGPEKKWFAFATGKNTSVNGDGFQASHWKQNNDEGWVQGIMDPLMKPGVMRRISNRDLIAMDAIGYDTNYKAHNLMNSTNASTSWKPVTGHGTDLGTLQWRAKDHIAKTLHGNGEAHWVDWWIQNDPNYSGAMTRNRDWDVNNMIDRSELYEHRRKYSYRTGSWGYRQEVFHQEAYFSSVKSEYFETTSIDPVSIFTLMEQIEPNTIEADAANETSDANTFHNSQEALEVASVAMNLLLLEARSESIDIVSTEIPTELIEDNLYKEQLEKSDLFLSFA